MRKYICGIIFCSFWLCGCAIPIEMMQAADRMDAKFTVQGASAEKVETCSKTAFSALRVETDGIERTNNNGFILKGHSGELDYIRIHLKTDVPAYYSIGVQARTALYPQYSSGYDFEFSKMLATNISQCLNN